VAIEVEMSHSLAGRIHIFAAMRVPEVWRYNGRVLRFCILDADGQYVDAEYSKAFPFLRPDLLQPYLALPDDEDETTRLRKYVNWLRANLPAK
jgi:hypothetical protein